MASLWKDDRTRFFVACFTAVVGNRRVQWKRSTGTDDRKTARRIMDELEDAAQGRRTADEVKEFLARIPDLRTRRVATRSFDEVMRRTVGSGLASRTTKDFVKGWLERTRGEVSAATQAKYEQTAKLLLESLGGMKTQDMTGIAMEHIARFRDEQGRRVSSATANLFLKITRIIFAAAESAGIISRNPAKNVKVLKVQSGSKRRAFTMPELNRLLSVADDEWRSLILFGFYTGARLGDLAALRWQQIDLALGSLAYTSRKTGRTTIVPLAKPLLEHIMSLPAGDDPRQPVHPRAAKHMEPQGRVGTLSRQFGEMLAEAGLVAKRTHAKAKEGKGRDSRRQVADVSFHALRHTAVSLLKSAGVSDAIAQDIAGHESVEISRHYTHIDDNTKREAVDRLPRLTQPA
jgi:integrase